MSLEKRGEKNMKAYKTAIIDIGSNSVRLVVYEIQEGYVYKEVQDVKMSLRLYQYLDEKGNLSNEGTKVLIETLKVFGVIIKSYESKKILATATAVIRQAKNAANVLKEVEKETGFKIRLLSEKEEAAYGQYAVARLTSIEEAYTVDMGGGSTEVTYFKGNELIYSHSFPFGVVALQEMFFAGKEPGDLEAMVETERFIKEQFATQDWLTKRNIPIVAIGGSSRNMASVHQRMSAYPISGLHGYSMKLEDIKATKFYLASKSLEQLRDLDGLSKDRADIIVPATITFQTLYQTTAAEKMFFVTEGLREGLLIDMINQENPDAYPVSGIRRAAISHLLINYGIDEEKANQRLARVQNILDLIVKEDLATASKQFNDYIYYAAMLYMVGSYVEAEDSSVHTFYLLANSNISGFTHQQRVLIALLASFKNKSLFTQYLAPFRSWFSDKELADIMRAGNLVRFCDQLNVVPVNKMLKSDLIKDGSKYRLKIKWKITPVAEQSRAERQKKRLEAVLGKKVTLDFHT